MRNYVAVILGTKCGARILFKVAHVVIFAIKSCLTTRKSMRFAVVVLTGWIATILLLIFQNLS